MSPPSPQTFDLRAGEVLAAEPGACLRAEPQPWARGWTLSFAADALDPAPGAAPHRTPLAGDARWLTFVPITRPRGPLLLAGDERRSIAALLARIERETRQPAGCHLDAARALVNLVLVQVTRVVARDGDFSLRVDPALLEIVGVIDARLSEPLSLDQLAAAVSRSPRQVSRIVHEQLGESVMRLIERRRMEAARRWLCETSASVNGIARAVGYSDPGYFRRRFRRAFGATPGAWRSTAEGPSWTAVDVPH